jgi:predicted lipoprotein with Yx(FWY)xxD motif
MATNNTAVVSDTEPRGVFPLRRGGRAARLVVTCFSGAAAAVLLAACASAGGSTGSGSTTSTGSGTSGSGQRAAASHSMVVSTRNVPGIGTVLVSGSGKTLYSPQQEAHGKIMCTGACLSFWFPVSVRKGTAAGHPSGITGTLGTIHRQDDGVTQLTINGMPLYTFKLDQAAGQANGNNFTDHFGSASFTWHAITASGAPAGAGQGGGSSGGYSGGSGY